MGEFADKYGPWAIIVGASDGVGALFAERVAVNGVNVVLVARRRHVLEEVAAGIGERTGVATRTLAVDLTAPDAANVIIDNTADLEVGMLVYCAGGDPNYQPFLANPVSAGEALLRRNCLVMMQLCHHYAAPMVGRGRGGIVNFTSGAALAGGPNMVAYGATKAFDLVFTEGLWTELHAKGVDVLALVLGKTDTPSLRQLEYRRGQISSMDEVPKGAVPAAGVIDDAFDNLANGPTLMVGPEMRMAAEVFKSLSRNEAVNLVMQASAAMMGPTNASDGS
ncbi:short-chain dehydrogenase [Mycobacterium intermedium]|uniref:Short-chain dehydrogenase n=1 Tax=Mycobacterium intermedium TaxID=28445 RepID=A0A1E3S6R4_MYCIE|nr:SDR family NAD(P)-dependent oxidoreductase [Mycobacterium intermedium]MCV6964147.1 SDR family NAD(P)-dependent oxidoreductase [Mycobacterium intermedium]ODQ97332.1 short-chain dehydrogenase [Mycobacterium intermedium]OPE46064.1 short-chain dehydrogenase [Mycobacterium intermedium]ORA93990.1 short-chain dehydrogenase [Mycobacterium intermedium]